jgi:hypothetical protein
VREKDNKKWTLVKAAVEEEEEKETVTKSTSGSNKDGLYAIMDLDASFKMQSNWSAEWTKPRLDSTTGFHNSKESAEKNKDFWIEIDMKKPSGLLLSTPTQPQSSWRPSFCPFMSWSSA